MTPEKVNCIPKFPVRFTTEELAHVQAKAALMGLTVADYIRTCMGFGCPA